jgi:hypothetical protein
VSRNPRNVTRWFNRQPDWLIYALFLALAVAILRGCL